MAKRSNGWVATLAVLLAPLAGRGADDPWHAVSDIPNNTPPAVTLEAPRPLSPSPSSPAPNVGGGREGSGPAEFLGHGLAPVSFEEPRDPVPPPPPDPPPSTHTVLQPDSVPPPTSGPMPPPPPPGDASLNQGVVIDKPLQHSFWDRCKEFCGCGGGDRASASGRCLFQSDHCFDYFASPVTNPFLFEDPRALTELKPLFIYQGEIGRAHV